MAVEALDTAHLSLSLPQIIYVLLYQIDYVAVVLVLDGQDLAVEVFSLIIMFNILLLKFE